MSYTAFNSIVLVTNINYHQIHVTLMLVTIIKYTKYIQLTFKSQSEMFQRVIVGYYVSLNVAYVRFGHINPVGRG